MQGTFTPSNDNAMRGSYKFDSESAGKMMVKLDDDKRVDMWDHRPFSIPYTEGGVPREFTPEFVVSTKNAFYVIEVLPHSEANLEANQEKWKSVKNWCEQQKTHFVVVTEKGTFKPFTVKSAAKDEDKFVEEVAEKPALEEKPAVLPEPTVKWKAWKILWAIIMALTLPLLGMMLYESVQEVLQWSFSLSSTEEVILMKDI